MKRNLIQEILQKTSVKEDGLRVSLSRIKKRYDLRSIDQAACFYIKKHKLDINVSSVIDDVTRQVLQNSIALRTSSLLAKSYPASKVRNFTVPKIKWMPIGHYSIAERLSDFYNYLYIFENALRIKIDSVMSSKYTNWWETKVRIDLWDIYKYALDEKTNQAKLPMIGAPTGSKPLDYLTVGHLEQIICKYQNDFVPLVFPNLQFFTGHMVIVKRVRNAVAHMSTATTVKDIRNAKNEIDILLQHLSTL
jgi:hypothetical protein